MEALSLSNEGVHEPIHNLWSKTHLDPLFYKCGDGRILGVPDEAILIRSGREPRQKQDVGR